MKVKELIKILKSYNPEFEVQIEYLHFEELNNCSERAYDVVADDRSLYIRTEDASVYDEEL